MGVNFNTGIQSQQAAQFGHTRKPAAQPQFGCTGGVVEVPALLCGCCASPILIPLLYKKVIKPIVRSIGSLFSGIAHLPGRIGEAVHRKAGGAEEA